MRLGVIDRGKKEIGREERLSKRKQDFKKEKRERCERIERKREHERNMPCSGMELKRRRGEGRVQK